MQFQNIAQLKNVITGVKGDQELIFQSMKASLKVSEVQQEHLKKIKNILNSHLTMVNSNKKIDMAYEFFK